jgi:hypothetical protein
LANAFSVSIKEEPQHQGNYGIAGQRRRHEEDARIGTPPTQSVISYSLVTEQRESSYSDSDAILAKRASDSWRLLCFTRLFAAVCPHSRRNSNPKRKSI